MKTIQKQHQAVLVLTDKDSRLYFNKNETKFQICEIAKKSTELKPNYFLYILSNEEIKEGDWIYDIELKRIEQCQESGVFRNWKKIIATTNPELNTNYCNNCNGTGKTAEHIECEVCGGRGQWDDLLKPTDQFIQQWIDKGTPEMINVEYEQETSTGVTDGGRSRTFYGEEKLKISSDNTITCSFIEDDWNKFYIYLESKGVQLPIGVKENLSKDYNAPTKKL